MKSEEDILQEYISKNNLKSTRQRKEILDRFLSIEGHISAEELYQSLRKDNPNIGLATVYRTLNLLCECGLAQQKQFGDGQTRYEHVYKHRHHDHLVCTECGKIIEFTNPMIEKLQTEVANDHNFKVQSHKLDLYGLCGECSKG